MNMGYSVKMVLSEKRVTVSTCQSELRLLFLIQKVRKNHTFPRPEPISIINSF
jgi:hypothetical protein